MEAGQRVFVLPQRSHTVESQDKMFPDHKERPIGVDVISGTCFGASTQSTSLGWELGGEAYGFSRLARRASE